MNTYILLFKCKDREGIVAKISDFIYRHSANIISLDQYTTNAEGGDFFMRLEFVIKRPQKDIGILQKGMGEIANFFGAEYRIYDKEQPLRMGIMVSGVDHCLLELLYLWNCRELKVKIPFIISNHQQHQSIAKQYDIPFYYIPATKYDRREREMLNIVKDNSDFLVLARYMLVLSGDFLQEYSKDIINIHHGFLPSFKGKNPYKEALAKGVKVIGATAHFVNEALDEGPIISQAVASVSHRDNLPELLQKGRNLEKQALAEAVLRYVDYRVIRHQNKTIVF